MSDSTLSSEIVTSSMVSSVLHPHNECLKSSCRNNKTALIKLELPVIYWKITESSDTTLELFLKVLCSQKSRGYHECFFKVSEKFKNNFWGFTESRTVPKLLSLVISFQWFFRPIFHIEGKSFIQHSVFGTFTFSPPPHIAKI